MNSNIQSNILDLASDSLQLRTFCNQSTLPVQSFYPGVQIVSSLLQVNKSMFQRVLQIQVNNQVFVITDEYQSILKESLDTSIQLSQQQQTQQQPEQQQQQQSSRVLKKQHSLSETLIETEKQTASQDTKLSFDMQNQATVNSDKTYMDQNSDQEYLPEEHSGPLHRKVISKQDSQFDRKNIVKNFVKAFRSCVHCVVENSYIKELKGFQSNEELEKFRQDFEDWISARNFNNSLIIDLMSNQYSDLFLYFLKDRAYSWIESSKIMNKGSHFQALKEYQNIVSQERGLSKVRVLKFRKNKPKAEDF